MAIYLVGGGPESCPTPGLLDGFRDEVAARGGPLLVVQNHVPVLPGDRRVFRDSLAGTHPGNLPERAR